MTDNILAHRAKLFIYLEIRDYRGDIARSATEESRANVGFVLYVSATPFYGFLVVVIVGVHICMYVCMGCV